MTQPHLTDRSAYWFAAPDGVRLAWHEMGAGRPVVLLHGLLGNGPLLAGSGPARALAARGYRVILPDLRGHGDSGRPHDPACYPPDVLADDGLALLAHLGLGDYVLGGYSLGGRLVLRLLARGARPARAIVGGQGLDALDEGTSRTDGYRRLLTALADGAAFPPGSQEAQFAAWIAGTGADPWAVRRVLDTVVATPARTLREVPVPTLVVVGDADSRGASAGELAALLPNARVTRVPGDHLTALEAPEFTSAVLEFLAA
jgi:pimeloyl-ACP methyl ester carboxylesterase